MKTSNLSPILQAIVITLSFIASLKSCTSNPNPTRPNGRFEGMFVFGTSVIDNGNNNYLTGSLAKVNYTPYGIDFPLGPTGRFTNGETIADLLCRFLGLPLIPAFLDPRTKGARILRGVNYGSGASGILDSTGSFLGEVISTNQQINNFGNVTVPELETLLGREAKKILSRYLFMVATGNNDVSGYFLNPVNSPLEAYIDKLMSNLSNQLKKLYGVGGRKFVLVSVYPLGCNPWIKDFTKSIGCNAAVNAAAEMFHTRLLNLVDSDLKPSLPGSEFIVVNTYNIIIDVINDPLPRGFQNVSSACCELKTIQNFGILCKESGTVCPNRDRYVFFDGQHNTRAINAIVAAKAFGSFNKSEVYPFNVMQLASHV